MSTKDINPAAHVESTPVEYPESMEKRVDATGGDDGLAFVLENGQDAWTEEEERKVLRKIDFIVLPMVGNMSAENIVLTPLANCTLL